MIIEEKPSRTKRQSVLKLLIFECYFKIAYSPYFTYLM